VKAHKDGLVDQIVHILSDGVEQGVFAVTDPKTSARAIFDATSRFHHPAHAEEWSEAELAARIDAVLALLLKGLEAPRKR
jgi:pyridoxal biosynthesis lyase PdxS